jgi:RNA polymerase sigma-70 factor, ECF subfamily
MTVPDEEATLLTASVAAAQAGDEDAFRVVYRALQPRLLRYLEGLVGRDADDVASETWLQVTRDFHTFRGDWDAFRGWVVTIGRHRGLDALRHQRRRPAVPIAVEDLVEVPAEQNTADEALDRLGTSEAIALIGALPRDQAEAILLRVVVGLDAKAAGRVLGKRPGAVRTAAYRGLRTLSERAGLLPPRPPVTRRGSTTLREVR